jgi:hypothetical protein
MKFMVTWKIPPTFYKEAVARFLKTGAPLPPGLKNLGRWHTTTASGFLLVEGTEDAVLEHMAEWADLLELKVAPVLGDAETGAVLSRMFGK